MTDTERLDFLASLGDIPGAEPYIQWWAAKKDEIHLEVEDCVFTGKTFRDALDAAIEYQRKAS